MKNFYCKTLIAPIEGFEKTYNEYARELDILGHRIMHCKFALLGDSKGIAFMLIDVDPQPKKRRYG